MTKRIAKKIYYRITFRPASPLSVGSGENKNADKDIIRDARGIPYIPATAIAGVTREIAVRKLNDTKKTDACFGRVYINRGEGADGLPDAKESRLVFYDARMTGGRYHTSVRDSVKLDEFKTAADGAKFDMEVLEPGVLFETFLEWSGGEGDDDSDVLNCIVQSFLNGTVIFGGKGTRGYGRIHEAEAKRIVFDLTDKSGVTAWLDFDLYAENAFFDAAPVTGGDQVADKAALLLSLKQSGGISIRKYTTKTRKNENDVQPDFEQLTVHMGEDELPAIPGTSWAGAFRHGMRKLGLDKTELDALFGKPGEKEENRRKSVIRFGETVLKNAHGKVLSRNAIDRFSGGTKDGALFTEKTYYDGETILEIGFSDPERVTDAHRKALAAAIADLHYGFLAIGGETSIGRGLFEVTHVNGKAVNDAEQVYTLALEAIGEVTS